MKTKEEQQTTTNARVERMLARKQILGCPICGPNSGCNKRTKDWKIRNWKEFRKTKYK